MKKTGNNAQGGYVLMMLLLTLMAMGGVVIAGYTQGARQNAEQSRYDHNRRLLEEAKQALLMYAYNYPTDNPGRGPGRLPCPDTDNDGIPNSSGNCINGTAMVGRLPNLDPDLNLYSDLNARRTDASGEDLWYAVSSSFANNKPPITDIINSDTIGTITLFDQTGNLIYDGAAVGIAAVIIAPGSITRRDNDDNGTYEFTQLRGTIAQRNDPRNYLDTFSGGFDNSLFNNGANNNADGFILGPIFDPNINDYMLNDQVIVITTDEVVTMAQKSVLQSYQDAINDYRNNIVGVDAYPWLDDYATQLTVLNDYDGDVGTRLGRLPSIFANYFAPSPAASQTITSNLEMVAVAPLTVNGFPVPLIDPGVISANASIAFNTLGDLTITPVAPGISINRYYWDEQAVPNGWQDCLPIVFGTERDCNQALANPGVPDSSIVPNQLATHVVRVTYTNNLVAGAPFTRPLSDGAGLDPVYQPPTVASHARVFFEYSEAFVDQIGIDFKYDNFYFVTFDDFLLGNANYRLGVIYYPELPDWALATENDWHDSVQMVYADAYEPGNVAVNCIAGVDCITVVNSSGATDDKIAVLALAAEHNFVDEAADGFDNDLLDIFDLENDDSDDVFTIRVGNDVIQVMR